LKPGKSRSVYRYFDPADSFVQILVCDGTTLELPSPLGLNRQSYRRLVIQTCMPEFRGELAKQLEQLFPEDPMLAEDLLYQLCTEVNPGLDIHTVRIQDPEHEDAEGLRSRKRRTSKATTYEDFLRKISSKSRGLERRLARRIVGQEDALAEVASSVQKAAAGLAAPNRPLGSFLFVGRTGTGKTELARTLAADLFSNANFTGIVRIDCSEFALAHEYSKLIGAPPGYVGHEDGGQLTESVQRNPECIVLFDEIEKAHPRMHNLLLQILEEGCLTDGKGRRVSFDRTFVVLTSNAGAEDIVSATKSVGFMRQDTLGEGSLRDITLSALERQFPPEFLGRLDGTTIFRELDQRAAQTIAQRHLTDLATRARRRGMRVAFTPAVARWVASRGFSPDYGARELRRVIQRELEGPLSGFLLQHEVGADKLLRVRLKAEEPCFQIED